VGRVPYTVFLGGEDAPHPDRGRETEDRNNETGQDPKCPSVLGHERSENPVVKCCNTTSEENPNFLQSLFKVSDTVGILSTKLLKTFIILEAAPQPTEAWWRKTGMAALH